MERDYIPSAIAAFYDWVVAFYTYLLANFSRWNVPNPEPILKVVFMEFKAARSDALEPNHGALDNARQRETRRALEGAVRRYAKSYLIYNPEVTDDDRRSLGLHIHDDTRTSGKDPDGIPEAEIDCSAIRHITLLIKNRGSARRGKPKSVHSVEIVWDIRDAPPAVETDLARFELTTANSFTLSFTEADRGRRVYFCMRWRNMTTGKGKWSEIYSAIIP